MTHDSRNGASLGIKFHPTSSGGLGGHLVFRSESSRSDGATSTRWSRGASVVLERCIRVSLQIRRRLLVHPANKLVQDPNFNPPLTTSTQLDRRQITPSHQCVSLSSADIEEFCHLIESKKPPVHTSTMPLRPDTALTLEIALLQLKGGMR